MEKQSQKVEIKQPEVKPQETHPKHSCDWNSVGHELFYGVAVVNIFEERKAEGALMESILESCLPQYYNYSTLLPPGSSVHNEKTS